MSEVQRAAMRRGSALEHVLAQVRSRKRSRDWLRVAAVAVVLLAAGCGSSAAPPRTIACNGAACGPARLVVSLTFDDAYVDQYLYLRPLLRAHHMNATYYVITADSDGPFRCCMSFTQLQTLQSEGDDVGGHGVNHVKLNDPAVSSTAKVADVCGSRTDLIAHGITDPVSYAYPFGAFNGAAEAIVAACGYGNSREGGDASLVTTTPSTPWAETLPPGDPYALRTVDVDAPKAKNLADLETFVNAAAAHGGAWLPLTFHQVCHRAAADYSTCMSSWSAIDDVLMGQFLDWLAAAGQPGGAPAGTVVETVSQAMTR